jgi:hypothetical protein
MIRNCFKVKIVASCQSSLLQLKYYKEHYFNINTYDNHP